MAGKILYVSPEAPMPETADSTTTRQLAEGGLRLGVLDNSKGNADHLLSFFIEGLRARMDVASVVKTRKPNASRPAIPSVVETLVRDADCVVSAMSD